jgi:hypothetical protein
VGVDILKAQWSGWYPNTVVAADDYLHEAALADNPPSGTFYDPERDGVRLTSMGVHEHWNNNTDRQYSRNLDPTTGTGIEMLWFNVTDPGDINGDKSVDVEDLLWLVECFGSYRGEPAFDQEPDLNFDGVVDVVDLLILVENFGTSYL